MNASSIWHYEGSGIPDEGCYSFDLDADGARTAYNKMFVSYLKTFARMGLTAIPWKPILDLLVGI